MGIIHENMARQAREAAAALSAVDVGEAESHSPAPHMAHQSGHRNRIVVNVGGSCSGLTSTDIVRVPVSDEDE